MNWLSLVIGLAIVCVSLGEQYTDRYDNINVDEIIENRRLFVGYINCMLDKGRCTPEGKELKVHVKDAMQTSCAKCTETQKQMARKVIKHLKTNEQDYWESLKAKFDPGDKYKETYEAFLAAEN